MSICSSCGNCLLREFFASRDEANLRLIVGHPGSEKEFWAIAHLVIDACVALEELVFCADSDGFHEALPGDGLRLANDDPAAWRCFLAMLHGFALQELELPCQLKSCRLTCFNTASKSSIRVVVGAIAKREAWEFYCDELLLSDASDYFRAAMHPGCWREGCSRILHFPEDSSEDWKIVLTSLHMDRKTLALPNDLHRSVRILQLCQKYLLDDLLRAGFKSLRDEPERIDQLGALTPEEFVEVAGGLDFLDMLPSVLSTWCLVGREVLAPHIAALLKDRHMAKVALTSRGVVSFVTSSSFLNAKGNLDADGPLVCLAMEGNLDILKNCTNWDWIRGPAELEQLLGEDALLPLLQVPAFKKALRDPRFCDASLADALAPFPSLLDDLLYEWFQSEQGSKLHLGPLDLSRWLACRKFRRQGLLDQQLASASADDFGAFILIAPLQDAEVAQATKARISSLASEGWREVMSPKRPTIALDAAAALLANRLVLKQIILNRHLASARSIVKLLASVILHSWLTPFQDAKALFRLFGEGVRNALCAQPRRFLFFHMVTNFRALLVAVLRMLAYEVMVSKTAICSIASVATTASQIALSRFRYRTT